MRALLACGGLLIACGCAPLAGFSGPQPVSGVPGTTPANALAAGSREPSAMRYGSLAADGVHPRTVLLYGDNRPGFRIESQRWEYHALKKFGSSPPLSVLRGLVALPVALVELVVPALYGPRDLVTLFTRRPTGGGESRVLRALERERAGLVISTGDVVTDGRRARLWSDFAARSRTLRERTPYVAAAGNHERTYDARGRSGWDATVMPPLVEGRYWGYLDDPATGARWVFLDSNVLTDVHGNRDTARRRAEARAQLEWADSVLAAPARFRFVVLHHPLVGAGHYTADWNRMGRDEAVDNRRRLFEILLARGVQVVFAGHEHLYQRLWVKGPHGNGFWHVTTGGGGSPLYVVSRAARERALNTPLPGGAAVDRGSVVFRTEYHYGRLELPAGNDASGALAFVVSRVTLGGRAVPIDSLDLSRGPGSEGASR